MTSPAPSIIVYRPRGAALAIFAQRTPEVVTDGPAGTGKSRGWLELMHLRAAKHAGSRHLIVRKTLQSLKSSTLVTFDEKVQPHLDGVVFKGDTAKRPAHYAYPNGSVIVIGGMDRATKVLSSEYDTIYVPEATELEEKDWETLSTRLRNGRMPYQQICGDCNPDAPTHWLKLRAEAGKLAMLPSRHEDNPLLFDDAGNVTAEGARYISVLDALTGVRKARYRYGLWAAAEGMVYQDSWARDRNVVDRAVVTGRSYNPLYGDCSLPRDWPRYMAVDFGYTNPFVCLWFAQDPDGRLYLYRELYATHALVEDHAAAILRYAKWKVENGRLAPAAKDADPLPRAIFCDHDAEGRATLERHLGWYTTPAEKAIRDGIQAVAARLKPAGDGKPRLYVLRDSLVERDAWCAEHKLPCSLLEEVEAYVWDTRGGRAKGEEPVDKDNHGLDALRYMVATLDRRPTTVSTSAFKVF